MSGATLVSLDKICKALNRTKAEVMDLCHRKKIPFRFHPEKQTKHGGVEPERFSFPLQEILKVVKPKKKTAKKTAAELQKEKEAQAAKDDEERGVETAGLEHNFETAKPIGSEDTPDPIPDEATEGGEPGNTQG